MEVVGFATEDFSGTKGDVMRVAEMEVFTQITCNIKLDKKLDDHDNCKYITKHSKCLLQFMFNPQRWI